MVVRTALVDKRAGMTIITWLSRSLAISIISMSIPTIVSMESLWTSMSITDCMTISWLSICRPLVNTVTIVVMGRVVAISMVSLGDIDRGSSISMAIAISSISRPLTIDISMSVVSMETLWTSMCITMASIGMECNTTIAIVSMVSSKTLCSSICVTMASIWMVGSTIARLCSGKAGEGQDNSYNFNCHGYKCTKLSQIAMSPC